MQRTALNHLITTTLLLSSVLLLGGWVGETTPAACG
jgi:hypothetical protein